VAVTADCGKQGCQMVPNLANITKNYCFPKTLETVFGNIFYAKFLPFFEIQIANIGKESILHYLSN